MATDPNITRIKFLRSKTANAKPLATAIDEGELAFNLTDRTIFSKSGTNVVELGFGKGGTVAGAINQTVGGITSTGTITAPTFSGALSGNASTATKLQTARTISLSGSATGSISFDGTSNQSISVNVNAVNSLATYARSNADSPTKWAQGVQSVFVSSEQGWPMPYGGVITARPHANGGGTLQILTAYGSDSGVGNGEIKIRTGDYSGTGNDTWTSWKTLVHSENVNDYSPTKTGVGASGSWGISVTGNAGSATVLQTARTIGGVSFNGSANINLPGVNIAGNQSTTGNAATATTLQTARTINGVSFNGTSDINIQHVAVRIPGNSNLNNYQTPGIYYCDADAEATSTVNTPVNLSYSLVVTSAAGIVQTFTAYNGGNNDVYVRGFYASSWSQWKKLAFTNDSITGNAATATTLQTARTIGGVSFNGTANINLPGVNIAGNQSTTGNAATATALQTARTINGTSFNGSANITTANWGTARNLTIGNTAKSVDGSGNVAWSLAEIGALPLSGGTATGVVSAPALGVNNSSATSGAGISLYSGSVTSQPQYGIMFAGTATFGGHGSVTSDWATYFTMTGDANRGWIFKHGIGTAGNVASISSAGVITASTFVGSLTGNASTATSAAQLTTARTIGGVSFNGSTNINLPGVNIAGNQSTTGNAATATTLQTARTINGVSFNGTANITVADSTKLPLTGGTLSGNLAVSGTITATGNITAFSDARIKGDLLEIEDSLSKVQKLTGYTYTRTDLNDDLRYVGLIAQDVQAVVPEAVRENTDGTLSVDYMGLVGLLVQSIKELDKRIKDLEEA